MQQTARGGKLFLNGKYSSKMAGKIILFIGPMFAGKTETLIQKLRRAALSGREVTIIKYAGDSRHEPEILRSHSDAAQGASPALGQTAPINVEVVERLEQARLSGPPEKSVIGVDEGQFFPDLVKMCQIWANEGRIVYVSALDGDYQMRPFGQVCFLVPHCEKVEKFQGVCMSCGGDSSFTKRIVDSDLQVLVGGKESYSALCRKCYNASGL